MLTIMNGQPNPTYVFLRSEEAKIIKRLINAGEKITYSATDSFIQIKNRTFNGWNKQGVLNLFKEEKPQFKKTELAKYICERKKEFNYKSLKAATRERLEKMYNELKENEKD